MHAINQTENKSKNDEARPSLGKSGTAAAIQITLNSEAITAQILEGTTYFSATRRGVEYTAYRTGGGEWFVATKRLALGRFCVGGGKHYRDLQTLCESCKAFAGLAVFISMTSNH